MTESFTLALERLRLKVSRPLSKEERILRFLKKRGKYGASNRELNNICFSHVQRIADLRKDGHRIRTEREGIGQFRFILEPGDAS